MAQIRTRLKTCKIGADVNDLDQRELVHFDLLGAGDAPDPNIAQRIRVATVDNYQGEEAKFIVITTVRSNKEGDIGFVSNEERVNVLLSRARRGMFIVGNLSCLTACRSARGRRLWCNVKSVFESTPQCHILPGFPAHCAKHPDSETRLLTCKSDFDAKAPNGGCDRDCGDVLACGHTCRLKCHPYDHEHVRCTQKVDDVCPYGHPLVRDCSAEPPRCKRAVKWPCSRNRHQIAGKCFQDRTADCKDCLREAKEREAMEATLFEEQEADLRAAAAEEARAKNEKELASQRLEHERALHTMRMSAAQEREEARLQQEELLAHQRAAEDERTAAAAAATATRSAGAPPRRRAPRDAADHSADVIGAEKAAAAGRGAPPRKAEANASPPTSAPAADSSSTSVPKAGKAQRTSLPATKTAPQSATGRPPAGTKGGRAPAAKAVQEVLLAYERNDVLSAHDKLEAVLPTAPPTAANSLRLLEWLLESEMTASVDVACPPVDQSCAPFLAEFVSMRTAIASGHPHTARKHAVQCREAPSFDQLPSAWRAQVEQEAVAVPSMSKPSRPVEDEAAAETTRARNRYKTLQREALHQPATAPAWPSALDQLMAMSSLGDIKHKFMDMYEREKIGRAQGNPASASNYNARFEGNPGTGKTTVARHYAGLLREMGIVPETAQFHEMTASQMITMRVEKVEKKLKEMKEEGGGVVFIDEAYQLGASMAGKEVRFGERSRG